MTQFSHFHRKTVIITTKLTSASLSSCLSSSWSSGSAAAWSSRRKLRIWWNRRPSRSMKVSASVGERQSSLNIRPSILSGSRRSVCIDVSKRWPPMFKRTVRLPPLLLLFDAPTSDDIAPSHFDRYCLKYQLLSKSIYQLLSIETISTLINFLLWQFNYCLRGIDFGSQPMQSILMRQFVLLNI